MIRDVMFPKNPALLKGSLQQTNFLYYLFSPLFITETIAPPSLFHVKSESTFVYMKQVSGNGGGFFFSIFIGANKQQQQKSSVYMELLHGRDIPGRVA